MQEALFNTGRAEEFMKQHDLDALVATTRQNFVYAADYSRKVIFGGDTTAALIVAGRPPRLVGFVLPRGDAGYLAERTDNPEVIVLYGTFYVNHDTNFALPVREQRVMQLLDSAYPAASLEAGIVTALRHLGLERSRVGWDDTRFGDAAVRELGNLRNVDARQVWQGIRHVKTPHEIDRLEEAARIAEKVRHAVFAAAKVGVQWTELMRLGDVVTVQAGATPGFWSCGTGPNAGFNFESVDRTLSAGDLLRFDFGCIYRYYHSDLGRTLALGEPEPFFATRYSALRSGVEAAIDRARPGATFEDLYDTAMSTARRAGAPEYKRHHCGHTIGLDPHDGLRVAQGNKLRLEPGMVLCIELPYYELGRGGVQVEDTIAITDRGCRLLSTATRDMVIQ